jgi:hypothetical protein
MGAVGPKVKELESPEEGREDPEQQQVSQGYTHKIAADIEKDCHGNQLQYGDIIEEEVEKPDYRMLAFRREIRVLYSTWVSMVCHMFSKHWLIAECSEQPESQLTYSIIYPSVFCY